MSNRIYSKEPKKPPRITPFEVLVLVIGGLLVLWSLLSQPVHADPGYERIQNCLAVNVYWEAASSGEPLSSQYLVALVTMNRSKAWHKDVCDVVFQKGQFSWTRGALTHKGVLRSVFHPPQNKAWERARMVAWTVLNGAADFTKGALYYHADYIKKPVQFSHLEVSGHYGHHLVYLPKIR